MRIAIDASRAARPNPTGTEAYASQIVDELARQALAHRLDLYYDRPPPAAPTSANVRVHVVPLPRLWTHARLSFELARRWPDVLFVPAHVVPALHPSATVVTLHDLGYLRYRLAYPPAAWLHLMLSTRWSAARARRIIVDSWATRRDLLRHCRVDPARVDVVHLAADGRFHPLADVEIVAQLGRHGLSAGYLLFVGTLQPRKNLRRLLRAYARARRTAPLPDLLLVGGSVEHAPRLDRWIDELDLVGVVHRPGYLPADVMPALYAGARAFLFPSLYEGFGLPLLESMAVGTPVLAGANSSMPEIVGDAGLLVAADDVDAIAAGIVRLASDAVLVADLRAAGLARARQFSWAETGRQTLAILERAGAGR